MSHDPRATDPRLYLFDQTRTDGRRTKSSVLPEKGAAVWEGGARPPSQRTRSMQRKLKKKGVSVRDGGRVARHVAPPHHVTTAPARHSGHLGSSASCPDSYLTRYA